MKSQSVFFFLYFFVVLYHHCCNIHELKSYIYLRLCLHLFLFYTAGASGATPTTRFFTSGSPLFLSNELLFLLFLFFLFPLLRFLFLLLSLLLLLLLLLLLFPFKTPLLPLVLIIDIRFLFARSKTSVASSKKRKSEVTCLSSISFKFTN